MATETVLVDEGGLPLEITDQRVVVGRLAVLCLSLWHPLLADCNWSGCQHHTGQDEGRHNPEG